MRTIVVLLLLLQPLMAVPKKVAVFVALCDNASQGIIPVPAKIGDGNKPEDNLYWGCTDGFAGCFGSSKSWKLQKREVPDDKRILERRLYRHDSGDIEITAEGWRGSDIKECLKAFDAALISGKWDLCAYIGHDVLMDADVPMVEGKASKPCDAIVLCCMSEVYFKKRLAAMNVRPVMLTTQLMYPGSFLLRDSLPLWSKARPNEELRQAAAAAYAKNQKISQKAAAGVFAKLP